MTVDGQLAELRAEWTRAAGDTARQAEIEAEAARLVLAGPPPVDPHGHRCNASIESNTCSGEVRLYAAGYRCDGHSPAAMRALLAERERRSA